jgi:hypothetical protein
MTKKHFEAIAAIIKHTGPEFVVAEELAAYFETINPNFDKQRFLTACGF